MPSIPPVKDESCPRCISAGWTDASPFAAGNAARCQVLLSRGRRVPPHVDHILDAVINIPLARFQSGGVRLADHCLEEASLTLINHEISRGPLLATKDLALQHPVSISHHPECACWPLGW